MQSALRMVMVAVCVALLECTGSIEGLIPFFWSGASTPVRRSATPSPSSPSPSSPSPPVSVSGPIGSSTPASGNGSVSPALSSPPSSSSILDDVNVVGKPETTKAPQVEGEKAEEGKQVGQGDITSEVKGDEPTSTASETTTTTTVPALPVKNPEEGDHQQPKEEVLTDSKNTVNRETQANTDPAEKNEGDASTQTSVASTTEYVKTDSTASANNLPKLPKALKYVDNKDSSIGTSAFFFLAALATFIVMTVAPAI